MENIFILKSQFILRLKAEAFLAIKGKERMTAIQQLNVACIADASQALHPSPKTLSNSRHNGIAAGFEEIFDDEIALVEELLFHK